MRSLLTSYNLSTMPKAGCQSILRVALLAMLMASVSALDTAGGKKLIEAGWDAPSAAYVRDNIALVESRDWFNGVTINCADGAGFRCFEPRTLTEAAVGLDAFAAIKWQSYTDNFLTVYAQARDTLPVDWFDDNQWAIVTANMRLISRTVVTGRLVGVWWDPEFYFPATSRSPWIYNTMLYPTATFAQAEAKLRQRGREYMQALQSAKPDIVVLATTLAVSPYNDAGGDRSRLPDTDYALLPGFVAGIIEAADARAQIIDGHELGYYTGDTSRYVSNRNHVVHTSASILPPDIVDFYRQRVGFGEAVYVEWPYWEAKKVWDAEIPELFWKHNVYNSLVNTDRYVWCYNEDGDRSSRLLNWWVDPMTSIPSGLVAATRDARSKLSAGTALGYDLCQDPGAPRYIQPRVISNPTMNITAPITGAQLTTGQTLSVSLSISGSPALVRTDLVVDGHLRGSSTGVAPQFNLSDLSVGTHLMIARGFRADGDHVSSNPVRVDVSDSVIAVPSVATVLEQFGKVSSDPGFTSAADANGDGRVDAIDLSIATHGR